MRRDAITVEILANIDAGKRCVAVNINAINKLNEGGRFDVAENE